MSYLAGWRLELAPELLVSSDVTVAAIARQVGCGTPFSFSAAFKRVHGVSPQQYRVGRLSAWREAATSRPGCAPGWADGI
jgi:AraC-like DNA-binding protein